MAPSRQPGRLALVALALSLAAACAKGNVGDVDGGGDDPDAMIGGPPDAPVGGNPDAAPMMRTLTMTTSDDIVPGSVACVTEDPITLEQTNNDNRYFRVFDLPALGIDSAFVVNSVTFGIETALSGLGTQPATVRLHRLNGAVTLTNLSQLASTEISIPDQDAQLFSANISATAPAGSKLAVELFIPNGEVGANVLFIGSNAAGESGPSYLVAPDCSVNDMMTTTALGFPSMHVIMKVTGTYNP